MKFNGEKIGFRVKCGFKSLFYLLHAEWPWAIHGVSWNFMCNMKTKKKPTIMRFLWWLTEMIVHSIKHTHVLKIVGSFLLPLPDFAEPSSVSLLCMLNSNFALLHSKHLFYAIHSCWICQNYMRSWNQNKGHSPKKRSLCLKEFNYYKGCLF